jgi:hypothetical protein
MHQMYILKHKWINQSVHLDPYLPPICNARKAHAPSPLSKHSTISKGFNLQIKAHPCSLLPTQQRIALKKQTKTERKMGQPHAMILGPQRSPLQGVSQRSPHGTTQKKPKKPRTCFWNIFHPGGPFVIVASGLLRA